MNTYLPASVRFPGNYVVRIKAIAPSTLRRIAREDCHGCWDCGTRTIYVDKTMSERKQRYILTHEMDHAFNDWRHLYLKEDQS